MVMRIILAILLLLPGAACASMSSTALRDDYTAGVASTEFTFTFPIYNKTNLTVLSNGVVQILDTNYTVRSGVLPFESVLPASLPVAGFIRFVVARVGGEVISIIPVQPIIQTSEYTIEPFPAARIERDFDKEVMISRALKEELRRTPKLKLQSLKKDLTIDDPVAGKMLRWKSDISGLENVDVSIGSSTGALGQAAFWNSALTVSGSGSVLYVEAQPNWNGSPGQNRIALQAAHDSLPSTGGTVILPTGVFHLDCTPIVITKPITITGQHGRTQGSVGSSLQTDCATGDVIIVNLSSAVHFRDFQMSSTVPHTSGAFIHFMTTNNALSSINNMTFSGHTVALDMEAASLWSVERSYFLGLNSADLKDIYIHSTIGDNGGNYIAHNVFDNGGTNGTAIFISSGGGTRIFGNQMLSHAVNITIDWLSADNSSEIAIFGNTFDGQQAGSHAYGLLIGGSAGLGSLNLVTVTGNSFAAHSVAEIGTGGSSPNKILNLVVTGNTFQVSSGTVAIDSHITNLHASGNTLQGTGTASGFVFNSDAVSNSAWGNWFTGTWTSQAANASASSVIGLTSGDWIQGIYTGLTPPSGGGSGTVTNTGTLVANTFILGNGGVDVKPLAITGLVLGNGASAPAAYAGSGACSAGDFITALSATGVKTCATPAGSGTVTTTGSPASGNLARFSGATSIVNDNLSGDVTTTNTLVTTMKNTGTAGTYGQVTTDAQGRVSSGTIIADVAHGGSGAATFTVHGVLLGQTTAAFVATAAGAANSVMQGQGAADPIFTTTPTVAGLTTTAQGALVVGPYSTGVGQTGEVRWLELAANGTNYRGFKSPDALTGSLIWTLPTADGTSGQCILTDGAGILSWGACSGGGSGLTSLNGLTTATQTFANDTNVTMVSAASTHTITWAGTLAVARGGLGVGTLTDHGVLLGHGTAAVTSLVGAAGQLFAGVTAGDPIWSATPAVTGFTTTGQSAVSIGPYGASTGNTGETRWLELAANGINYAGFKAKDTLAGNIIWTLPSADAVGCLQSDGALSLSISTCPGVTGAGTSTQVLFYTGASTVGGNSNLIWDTANKLLTTGTLRANGIQTLGGASQIGIEQNSTTTSRINAWGPNASTNGILAFFTTRSDASNQLTPMKLQAGVQIGAPAGGDKGIGTVNIGNAYYINGTIGLTQVITLCGGTITVTAGIITGTTC